MISLLKVAATTAAANSDKAEGLADKIGSFFDYIIGQVPSWIAGVIVFVLSFAVARLAKTAVESRISDKVDEEHQEILILAGRVSYFGTLIVGITIALKIAGIDLTTILAAVAFGIGFALQDLIMNFLSGVLILLNRQFTIGDFIRVGATYGKVMEIQTRATIIKAIDGTKVIVPNADIFRHQVISYTTNPTRRVAIPIYIPYNTDIRYAVKVATKVLRHHPKILQKPLPTIIIKEYGDSSISLEARFWVGSRDGCIKIKSDVMRELLETLQSAGIDAPYNIMHIETEADTKEYNAATEKIRREKMIEMKMLKAIEEDKKEADTKATPAPAVAASAVASAPANTPAISATSATETPTVPDPASTTPIATAPALAPVTVAAADASMVGNPGTGDFNDMDEIDGQG